MPTVSGGALMLGPSESLGSGGSDFEAIDETHRIYVKVRSSRAVACHSCTSAAWYAASRAARRSSTSARSPTA